MTLKDMVKKFVDEAKAGKVAEAMETAAEILKTSAGFYKLLFGTSAVPAVSASPDEYAEMEADLNGLKAGLLCSCETRDGSCKQLAAIAAEGDGGQKFDPTPLILGLVEMLLRVIAERRKGKQ